MRMIDLCSGLGGASQAFLDRGWEVIRIDNDPQFKDVPHTIIGDVRQLSKYDIKGPIDFVWASPPCNCFSICRVGKYWDDKRPRIRETIEALRIVFWCFDAIEYLKPRYWCLENPRDMLRNVLGIPGKALPGLTTYWASWGSLYLKPTDIWGELPEMEWPEPEDWVANPRGAQAGIEKLKGPERAKIPYKLSLALCQAIEREVDS